MRNVVQKLSLAGDQIVRLVRHSIEVARQVAEFIPTPLHGGFGEHAEIARCDLLRHRTQAKNGSG